VEIVVVEMILVRRKLNYRKKIQKMDVFVKLCYTFTTFYVVGYSVLNNLR